MTTESTNLYNTALTAFEIDYLFKKSLGTPAANTNNNTYAGEAPGSARPNILSSQVYTQSIPAFAPGTNGYNGSNGTAYSDLVTVTPIPNSSGSNYAYKQVSATYSWIAFYTLELQEVTSGFSYRFANPATNVNLLTNAIPFNYDITNNSYGITVYYCGNGNHTNLSSTNSISSANGINIPSGATKLTQGGTYAWVLDSDAGYLYFPASNYSVSSFGNPYISFWRYEGTTAANGNSTLATQFTN